MDSSEIAIYAKGIGKRFKLYSSPVEQALDLLGILGLSKSRQARNAEHVALNNLTLSINRGERVGLIGRNGAGKTTFLKLISGTSQPSDGELLVNGNVQALMSVGIGFHPEFTGRQNIEASLMYNGLSGDRRRRAGAEIIEFVELGEFLDQPIKTYSLGMKSRLQFACATAIEPDILVVDEILGAGDAYFSAKSASRMKALTESGVTLLLVSHSMGQVLQFCERAIWIEGGEVVSDGSARSVVQKYEKFTHELRKRTKISEVEVLNGPRHSNWLKEITLSALSDVKEITDSNIAMSSRWANDESPIEITSAQVLNGAGVESSYFCQGDKMVFRMCFHASKSGTFPCRFVFMVFASDGRIVGRHCSEWFDVVLFENEVRSVTLSYDPLLLGPGSYFYSCAIYKDLDLFNLSGAVWYDLYSRAFDFEIGTGLDGDPSLFMHPCSWLLLDAPEK